jgi:hypothetical protein
MARRRLPFHSIFSRRLNCLVAQKSASGRHHRPEWYVGRERTHTHTHEDIKRERCRISEENRPVGRWCSEGRGGGNCSSFEYEQKPLGVWSKKKRQKWHSGMHAGQSVPWNKLQAFLAVTKDLRVQRRKAVQGPN